MNYEKILNEAYAAATAAILAHFDDHKEMGFNCGFAWVTIDGTDALARYCRKQVIEEAKLGKQGFYGTKGYPSGWQFWGPGEWPNKDQVGRTVYGQDMDFKAAGARAFQLKLAEYGIRATVGTRLD